MIAAAIQSSPWPLEIKRNRWRTDASATDQRPMP
jgi:hypothetical protein